MSKTIQLKGVSKDFKGDGVITKALNNITLSLQKGIFTSIIGSSGSGKSTLLSLIGTLDKPSDGKIFYDEKEITNLNNKSLSDIRFEKIGFIFQQFHLLPTLTALENVMVPLLARNVSYNKKKRAEEILYEVGLGEKLNALPSQLSGGQQQRVAIARAIVHHPDWILADEPTGNLDTESGNLVFNLLRRLNTEKEVGIVFVTHDSRLAEKTDRIVELKDGIII
ncbi:ABC transporter ATP-binding protein [Bacillus sp. APMAM]|uniref:ABC transporter ATP-binding protein n=1 Tax=Margalitia sp. FSL K6-0131 TaxID=2954604 RepID=UPI000F8746C3|nr:ABC transporter ATP-binding protein [Bacillus sp. APMAM]RTZ56672.1 ABC transporter ATP-binding protein [Bacillus sp. SAJ1]